MNLGTDPEVFAWSASERKVVPAYFAMGGDLDWELPFGAAYPDGAAVEFTVSPSDSAKEMRDRVWANLRAIQERLAENDLTITLLSNANIAPYIPLLPESYGKRASLQVLGCNADVRVYDNKPSTVRPDPKVHPYRTIGAHIHIELPEALIEDWKFVQVLTAALDQTLGLSYTALYGYMIDVRERMKLYGTSGTIRLKTRQDDGYNAVEYRVLPSCAVLANEESTEFFFDLAKTVSEHMQECYSSDGIQGCIKALGGIENIKSISNVIDGGIYRSAQQYLLYKNTSVLELVDYKRIHSYRAKGGKTWSS